MDLEFEKVGEALEGDIVVNTAAAREHVGEVEREIRLVKERSRGVVSCLPYTRLHKQIVINLVYFSALWLNAFVRKSGCSTDFSPRAIVLRTTLSYKQHCRAQFGEYCEAHEDATKTNTMDSRTFPAICLGPTGNRQGTYKMFDLETCRVHKVRSFTRMIMPESVVAQVNDIGARTQREVYDNVIEFADRNKRPFVWDPEDDLNEMLESFGQRVFPDIPAEFPAVNATHPVVVPTDGNVDIPDTDGIPSTHATAAEVAAVVAANSTLVNNETLAPADLSAALLNDAATAGVTPAQQGDSSTASDEAADLYSKVQDEDEGGDVDVDEGENDDEIPGVPLEEELELNSTGVPGQNAAGNKKKRRSADDQVIGGPDQEWESKSLAGTDGEQFGRDADGRSRRIRQSDGQILCQRASEESDASDAATVKTSNARSAKKTRKMRRKQRKDQARARDADLQMLDEEAKAVAPERDQRKRQKAAARKKAARKRKRESKARAAVSQDAPVVEEPSEARDADARADEDSTRWMDVVMKTGKPSGGTTSLTLPGPTKAKALNKVLYGQSEPEAKNVWSMSDDEREEHVLGIVLTQYSLKRGLAKFGEEGEASAEKEMRQFVDYGCISPIDPSTLSREDKKKALQSFMFLKQKRDGELKSRAVVNGSKQRSYINKEDASSPTPSTDAIFITAAIDAYERRHVGQFDIPGAFLHTDSDEEITVVLEGTLAEIMARIDPQVYRKHITKNGKGKPLLYVKGS